LGLPQIFFFAADLRGLLKDYLLDTFVEQNRFKMIQQYCSASQMV